MEFNSSDYVNNERIDSSVYVDICDPERPETSYDEHYSWSNPKLYFDILNVVKGDTLKFSFHGLTSSPSSAYGAFGDIEIADRDPYWSCHGYWEGWLQDLEWIGIGIQFIGFSIWHPADTLYYGSSTPLYVSASSGMWNRYGSELNDSLVTFEVDSTQYVKFIYIGPTSTDTLDSPLENVKFSDAVAGKVKYLVTGQQPVQPAPVAFGVRLTSDPVKVWDDTIVVKGSEILLGETKYYYACLENSILTIKETKSTTLPPNGIGTDVWVSSPVTPITDRPDFGKKMGVYWEKGKPLPDDTTTNLPDGMIRLVGRYWHKDSIYTVRLKATYSSQTAEISVEVKKPDKLGDDYGPFPNGQRRTSVADVYSNTYNLDSIIVEYSGIYGIPPQILKADMQQEGNFQPAYRWEPFVDANFQFKRLRYMNDDFRYKKTVNPNSEGQPGIPTNHTNVYPIPYPQNCYDTIWNRFFAQSETLNPDADINWYSIEWWWSEPADEWSRRFQLRLVELVMENIDPNVAENQARSYANQYLMNEYQRGIMSRGISQTRTAASYGLMQMQYATAVEYRDYPLDSTSGGQDHLPEYLNITDTNLTYAVPFLLSRIARELTIQDDGAGKPDNWTLGFERTILVALNMYNGCSSRANATERYNRRYGFEVLDKVYQYLPE